MAGFRFKAIHFGCSAFGNSINSIKLNDEFNSDHYPLIYQLYTPS